MKNKVAQSFFYASSAIILTSSSALSLIDVPINPPPPGCEVVMYGPETNCLDFGGDSGMGGTNVVKYGPTAIPTTAWVQYFEISSATYENTSPQCETTNPTVSLTLSGTFTESWNMSTTYTTSIGVTAGRKVGIKSISQTVGLTANMSESNSHSYGESFTFGSSQTHTVNPAVKPCWNYVLMPYVNMQDYIAPFGYWGSVRSFNVWCDSNNNGFYWNDTFQAGDLKCNLIEGAGYGSVMTSGVKVEDRGSNPIDNYAQRCPCTNDDGGGGGDDDCDCSDDLDPNGDEDNDGTLNGEDDTPYGYDGDDPDGDADGDGTSNADDATPYGYDGDDPDGDDDGDGIPNSQDPDPDCPYDPEGDNDGDGIPNCEDDTPNGDEPSIDPDLKQAILDEIDGLTRIA